MRRRNNLPAQTYATRLGTYHSLASSGISSASITWLPQGLHTIGYEENFLSHLRKTKETQIIQGLKQLLEDTLP